MAANSKSALHYRSNSASREKKRLYDKKYNAKKSERQKRVELVQERRKRNIYGKGGGDLHHGKNGLVRESVSKNRGRKEKSRKKGSTRRKRQHS